MSAGFVHTRVATFPLTRGFNSNGIRSVLFEPSIENRKGGRRHGSGDDGVSSRRKAYKQSTSQTTCLVSILVAFCKNLGFVGVCHGWKKRMSIKRE